MGALLAATVALGVMVKAAQVAVDHLVAVARAFKISDAILASTIVAVGTSLPEIGSHLVASAGILSGTLDYRIASATVIGGNMGSSTVQQTLLVGVFVLGIGRTAFSSSFLRSTYYPMILTFVATLVLALDGTISRLDGVALLVGFGAYVLVGLRIAPEDGHSYDGASTNHVRDVVVAVGALVLVFGSAYVVLAVVQDVVGILGLNGSMVGVVTIGLASALPELTTVVEAIRRRSVDIGLGTLIGSNVVNPLVGFGLGGLLSTYAVPPSVIRWDLPFKLFVAVGFLLVVRRNDGIATRREGTWLVGAYFVFVSIRFLFYAT
ncbi:sodium:calcium antiporter [Haloferax mediterranei ATCC 33500]|uniref:Na+/Ca2+-antiporter-like protein n=1 Tax=Haloferax mediterranei (strain ATCC 33500 / DSM 1411 / JCM 8866 / NBRC 14739 / NCIMB 2177 / R-4) TaxID=523841 RepID=I3R0N4_HALMT|nr:sodium:calcium antiporter [Haloferax mediterranei]AFK17794.1 Na+/Ca2+-antiporter-like protein [Haloferax mediterranei ATCC 33500]AHZ22778.1 sodium:calcium antiporter [Haloferax mediterranei ATCC 33500]EMA02935.1 Na+/Ca2+-antiporter-like protein [Haloferax mediterranei ATCC 33500]QCQ74357.1 sodium:calcium antiporter [Haloferax mediterranei ATCC 33500]